MAVGPQPQHHQIQTASLFQLAIVLSGVVQRQLVNVLFFDLRRGKNSWRKLDIVTPSRDWPRKGISSKL